MLALVIATASFHAPSVHYHSRAASVLSRPYAAVMAAADVDEAAAAVKEVAAKFGAAQAEAAQKWVDAAISSEGCPTESLIDESLTLFEECLLDDDSNKCKNLDSALTAFEESLTSKKGRSFGELFGASPKQRAAARVIAAAGKFGKTQQQVAKDWTSKALVLGTPEDGPSLMEQQLSLFGTCQVQDDGSPDPLCVELFESLDNLQVALTGSVQKPTAAGLQGSGFEGGQKGQFSLFGGASGRRNNGCWPYN